MNLPFRLIEDITNNFSDDQRIGSGGYGEVYKAEHTGEEIAVKKLYNMQAIDDREFNNVFRDLVKVKHRNIVRLIGYCYEKKHKYVARDGELILSIVIERVLCFQYIEGGSLAKHISDESYGLDWPTRYKIIKGICKGLNHLHNGRPNDHIYHLGLKPGNILLDENMKPLIADFGMSRLLASSKTDISQNMKRTLGYMPPEFIDKNIITEKYDVFSAGVIIIQIIAGAKGYANCCEMSSPQHFIGDVHEKWKKRLQAMPKQENAYIIDAQAVESCLKLAVKCVEVDPAKRPTILEVVDELYELDYMKRMSLKCQRADRLKTMTSEQDNTSSIKPQMDNRVTTARIELERMLFDESAKAIPLPLLLLEHITGGFSDENQIGHGGFATVYKGMLGNGIIAVKKLFGMVDIDEKKFTEEIRCLMMAQHKNIVRFLGYCANTQGEMVNCDGKLVLADIRQRLLCFEYLPKGSLDKHITDASAGLEWKERYEIINGVCDGLHHLHQMHIVHLDIKPENILLDDNMMPKIADFGISRCFEENQSRAVTSKMIGTMGYLAPEFYRGGHITLKSDLYSVGIVIIEILTGKKSDPDIQNVLESWRNRLEKSEVDTQLLQVRVCTEIAMKCTKLNPARRPDIQDVIDRLGAIRSVGNSATEIGTSSS